MIKQEHSAWFYCNESGFGLMKFHVGSAAFIARPIGRVAL
ncbi:hypothetical protein BQ8482_90345 [Mesorhizobium delmotii]|uniref:Uncharacterized protein n=1 Tax=Mesorhizobium delmotii TaxID=1631247 RepID=A0A2P9AXS3_9HYPH|nr:hypothetical protein BQ8482_90345 [Mesorhizobium delmotii]